MDGKPSLATEGLTANLHRLFLTPEKTHQPKPALDALEDENNESRQKEDERGEAITIAPNHEVDKEYIVEKYPEDSVAVAKAACIETTADKQKKTNRTIRKAERTFRRSQKAQRQIRLAQDTDINQEEDGPTGDGKIKGVNDRIDNIGASATEGAPKYEVNIVLKNTSLLRATLFNSRPCKEEERGQPAKEGADLEVGGGGDEKTTDSKGKEMEGYGEKEN